MTLSIKQVLVHLDPGPSAAQRLKAARDLAREHGAALSALYATLPVFAAVSMLPEAGAAAVTLIEVEQEQRDAARRMFDATVATPGPAASWGEAVNLPLVWSFAQQAFLADLLVLGQRDPADWMTASVPADFPEAVLLASGRPALVVPYAGCPETIGTTAVVAWKPTREATRAVAAALPLLQRAGRVHVLCWGKEEGDGIQGTRLDLDGYLKLHGVHATWHRDKAEPKDVGEILLSRVSDLGADLLVMGCYGHSRAREWVLGGASRSVLAAMTVPVLMSH